MPILLRYKREHPDRIPSAGSGAQQRFPEEAFTIFEEIHRTESEKRDLPRRGGFGLLSLPRVRRTREESEGSTAPHPSEAPASGAPATTAAAAEPDPDRGEETRGEAPMGSEPANERGTTDSPAPASTPPSAAAPASPSEATLTMKDVAEALGIAYPTIARYVSKHGERIPYEGEGRQRRFPPEALDVFRQIRKESKPGRPPKSGSRKSRQRPAHAAAPSTSPAPPLTGGASPGDAQLLRRIERLERHQQQLETMVRGLRDELDQPVTAIVEPA